MIINFLQQFKQLNTGDNQGTIWATKNIDPSSNKGKVKIASPLGFTTSTAIESNLGAPAWGFAFTSAFATDRYYAVADDRVWQSGSTNPNDSWTEVSSTPTDIDANSDIIAFNSKIYIATQNNLKSYNGTSFSNINGISSVPHSMTVFANRLYVSDNSEKVESMNTSEVYVTSGSNTIDLNTTTGERQLITKIKAVSGGIWIATIYTDKSGGEMVFWDGETENVASARYILTRGALSMEIIDDRPYIVDSLGRIRMFDGTTFIEIGRLPITDDSMDNFNDNSNDRFIHPNGMIRVEDEIYLLVNNLKSDNTQEVIENMPSGIWAYSKDYGVYHKYSIINADITAASPSDTQVDFGVSEVVKVGALFRSDATGGSVIDREDESEVLAGISFYSDATTTKAAIGVTKVIDDIKKGGYLATAQLNAEQFDEAWKEVIAVHDRFKNSTDRIVIKYRTYESEPIYGTGTWAEDTRFSTNTDVSSLVNGDEIEILRGTGAGECLTVDYISGTQVRLKENFLTGMTGTLRFRGQKWKEVGKQVNQDEHFIRRTLDADSGAWVQFKIFLVGTGKSPQLIKLLSVSDKNENTN